MACFSDNSLAFSLSLFRFCHHTRSDLVQAFAGTSVDYPGCHWLAPIRLIASVLTRFSNLSLETVRVHAALLLRQRQFQRALDLPCYRQTPQHLELQAQFVNAVLEARSQTLALPALRHAMTCHGEHPACLPRSTANCCNVSHPWLDVQR